MAMDNTNENTESTPKKGGYGNPPAEPWKKGDPSPNPAGRPKGSQNVKTVVRKWLEALERSINPINGQEEELTQLDIITLQQLKKAKTGDTTSFNALLDRAEGKPMQTTEIKGDGSTIFEIVYGAIKDPQAAETDAGDVQPDVLED